MSSPSQRQEFQAAVAARLRITPFAPPAPAVASDAPSPEPPRFRPQIMRSLRMHPVAAGLVAAAVALFMVYSALEQVQVYQAQSLVYVEPVVARNLNEQGAPGFDQFRYGSFVDQQMQTATRPDVLTAALRSLPAGTWRKPKETEQSAVLRLQKALVVERLLTSYQMSIKLKAESAQSVAAVVNAVTNAYMQSGRNDELSMSRERQILLTEERQRITEQLDADQKEQAALGNKLGVANPENSLTNPFDAETTNLRMQLAAARQARDVAQAQLASISGPEASHRSGLTAAADESLVTDLGLGSMKSSVNARRALLQSQMAGLTQNNPTYKQDQDELADLDRSVESMSAQMRSRAEHRIEDRLRTELQRTADVEAQLNRQLAVETAKAAGAGPKLQRASELAVDIQRLHAQYTSVDDALNALELQTNGPAMAHIALTASVPAAPEPSRRGLLLLAALPFGLLCGLSVAVLLRARDSRLYSAADLEEALGFAPIAVMPSREDIAPRVADQYVLRLAAGIEHAYRTGGAQTFIVTAVSPSSDTAALLQALANKLEHMRLDVAVRRAGELLIMSKESAEHVAASAQGRHPLQHVSEGVAAAKLLRLRSEHAIVLIDGAPLLHSAETEYAARCADATVIVVESAVTRSEEVKAATALLARMRINGIAAVLADVRLKDADPAFRQTVLLAERRNRESLSSSYQTGVHEEQNEIQPADADLTSEEVGLGSHDTEHTIAALVPMMNEDTAVPVGATSRLQQEEPALESPGQAQMPEADQSQVTEPAPSFNIEDQSPLQPAEVVEVLGEHAAYPWFTEAAEAEAFASHPEVLDTAVHAATVLDHDWSHSSEAELTEGLFPEPEAEKMPALTAELLRSESIVLEDAAPLEKQHETTLIEEPLAIETHPIASPEITGTNLLIIPSPIQLTETATTPLAADALGKLFDGEDHGGTIPPYTRSRIRTTFKEQEVNAKTAWFSKLFRGDAASASRIRAAHETPATAQPTAWNATGDPAGQANPPQLEDLLRRINSRAYKVPGREFDTPGVALINVPAADSTFTSKDSAATHTEEVAVDPDLSKRRQDLPLLQGGSDFTGQPVARREAVQPINEEGFVRELERLSTLKAPIWPTKASGRNLSGARTRATASRIVGADRTAKDLDSRIHSLTNGSSRVDRARSNSSQRPASRLDPIVPLRAEPAPWHERLSSMRPAVVVTSSTAAKASTAASAAPRLEPHLVVPSSNEPAARTNSGPTLSAKLDAVAPMEPESVTTQAPELITTQPESTTAQAPEAITSRQPMLLAELAAAAPAAGSPRGLTRRWGLLSQYDPTAGTPSDATRMHRAAARSRRFQENE